MHERIYKKTIVMLKIKMHARLEIKMGFNHKVWVQQYSGGVKNKKKRNRAQGTGWKATRLNGLIMGRLINQTAGIRSQNDGMMAV